MTTHHFRDWKPQAKTELLVNVAADLLARDPSQTVRQVFYAMVRSGKIASSEGEFKKLVRALTEARMSGRLDWDLLPDTHPGRVLQRGESGVEVWVERDSLLAQTVDAVKDLDVSVVTFRAYPSTSVLWAAAERDVKTILVPGVDSPRDEDVRDDLERRLADIGCQAAVAPVWPRKTADDIEQATPYEYAHRLLTDLGVHGVGPARFPGYESRHYVIEGELGASLSAAQLEAIMGEVGETTRAASLKAKIREALS